MDSGETLQSLFFGIMTLMIEIIPAILTNSPEEARALLSLCDNVSNRTQIDIIDGEFSKNKTVFPESFEDEVYTTKLDFHLMVKEPINWIDRCIRGNADRIIGQIELMSDQVAFVNKVIEKGVLVGLAVDLDTEISRLDEETLSLVDVVLVMSVNAGFGGQTYDKRALEKISKLAELRASNNYHFKICDDGGVTLQNELDVIKAGSDEVAIGKRIFEGDLQENIEHFVKATMR